MDEIILLLVDPEEQVRTAGTIFIPHALQKVGMKCTVIAANSLSQARGVLGTIIPDVVLSSILLNATGTENAGDVLAILDGSEKYRSVRFAIMSTAMTNIHLSPTLEKVGHRLAKPFTAKEVGELFVRLLADNGPRRNVSP
jgi:hypothetical protein